MADVINGIELISGLTQVLNNVCRTSGGIEHDNAEIWDTWLHELTNEEWLDLVEALEVINDESPASFYPADLDVIAKAKTAIQTSINTGKSFVGKKKVSTSGNKNLAWQTAMRTREIINRYRGQNIPNRPPSIYGEPKTKITGNKAFKELFE